jgi:transcriptional regulator with XRE-family HTH domain
VWHRFGPLLKRRRQRAKLTQDMLAAKVGVSWNTIARLETGGRRPSLDLLEQLARVLDCHIRDLIPEKEEPMDTATVQREPSLRGAPAYFRNGVVQASRRVSVGRDVNTDRSIRVDYWNPGWQLAIHAEEYLSDDAIRELDSLAKSADGKDFERKLLAFLEREFPGCLRLIPRARRSQFMRGVLDAIDDGRFQIRRPKGWPDDNAMD